MNPISQLGEPQILQRLSVQAKASVPKRRHSDLYMSKGWGKAHSWCWQRPASYSLLLSTHFVSKQPVHWKQSDSQKESRTETKHGYKNKTREKNAAVKNEVKNTVDWLTLGLYLDLPLMYCWDWKDKNYISQVNLHREFLYDLGSTNWCMSSCVCETTLDLGKWAETPWMKQRSAGVGPTTMALEQQPWWQLPNWQGILLISAGTPTVLVTSSVLWSADHFWSLSLELASSTLPMFL